MIIGIIGGKGLMGRLFEKALSKYAEILVSDIDTELTSEQLIKKSDIVIYSVPINKTVDIIRSTIKYTNKNQLLMDFTSTKTRPVEAMLESEAGVVGLHPMFGPGVKTLEKQTIITCPVRTNDLFIKFVEILKKENAKLKESTPEKHDKMMSIIQGVKHFSSITMSYALKELDIDVEESLEYTSPIYRLEMDLVGRILNQSPELYADIELNIDHSALETYMEVQKKLLEIIKNKDRDGFIDYFSEASDHLGKFKEHAEKESDYIINNLIKK